MSPNNRQQTDGHSCRGLPFGDGLIKDTIVKDSALVQSQSFIPQGMENEASARRKGYAGGQPKQDEDHGPLDQDFFSKKCNNIYIEIFLKKYVKIRYLF